MISVCIPYYPMKNAVPLLRRCLESIEMQSYKDYEVVITQEGTMPENTNASMKKCRGDIIKILYMDDFFAHPDVLQIIADSFTEEWMIMGCDNNPKPYWTDDIHLGNNRLGSPSTLVLKNHGYPFLFDENLTWLLDCDYYKRLHRIYGPPQIIEGEHIIMGIGDHQMTHILSDEKKLEEYLYMKKQYDK
jgi:hypothetical protein